MSKLKRAAIAAATIQVLRVAHREGPRYIAHNLIGHPLLVLAGPAGEWVHRQTIPEDDDPEGELEQMTAAEYVRRGGLDIVDEPRPPSLGGTIDGTGYWLVDDLGECEEPLTTENVGTRPALRDPSGRSWDSWLNLPHLVSLRTQLEVGAEQLRAGNGDAGVVHPQWSW